MRQVQRFAVAAVCGAFGITALFALGLRGNTTVSYPLGLYWATNKTPSKGDLVMFCPTNSPAFKVAKERHYITAGFCEGNYGKLMKKILAAKGDVVSISPDGVTINGQLLEKSKPYSHDNLGRPMPAVRLSDYQLTDNEYLLMSDYSGVSFDGRYYGVLPATQVVEVVQPLLTGD